MVICHFFVQGRCRFGNNCRNEHPRGGPKNNLFGGGGDSWSGGGGGGQRVTFRDSFGGPSSQGSSYKWGSQGPEAASTTTSSTDLINALPKELERWETSKMWPFSCMALDNGIESLPELYDVSVEELRLEAYEATKSGNLQPYLQKVQSLTSDFQTKRNQFKTMDLQVKQKLLMVLEEARKKKATGPSGGPFTSSQPTQGLFGQAKPSTAANPFGQTPSTQPGNPSTLFGKPVGGNGFGSTSSGGGPSSTSFGSSSLFGKPQGTTSSVFGGQTSNVFGSGQSAASSSNPFKTAPSGTPGFASPSVFGGQGGTTPSSSLFGQATTTTPTPGQTNPFASTQSTPVAPQSLFGKPAATTGSGFSFAATSQGPAPSQQTLFGQAASTPGAGQPTLFGKPVVTAPPPQPPSLLGPPPPLAPTPAGSSQPGRYTPLDDLTPAELAEFKATAFTLGKIPLRPPPRELIMT